MRKTMSNLTIQTMIDALLPRLYSRDALDIQAYTGLLRESIQRSQQAAFRRYGTTSGGLSAALVIDGIACIALARDCRIYLYDNHLSLLIAGVSPAPGDVEDDAHSPANVQVLDRPSGQASSGEFGLSVVSLDAGNKLFFCTGELCSMISDADIAEIFRKRPRALEKICGAILEMAHTGEGNDLPVSMIVGQFNHGSSALFTPLIDVNLTVHAKPEAVTIPPLPLPSGRKPPSKKK